MPVQITYKAAQILAEAEKVNLEDAIQLNQYGALFRCQEGTEVGRTLGEEGPKYYIWGSKPRIPQGPGGVEGDVQETLKRLKETIIGLVQVAVPALMKLAVAKDRVTLLDAIGFDQDEKAKAVKARLEKEIQDLQTEVTALLYSM